ncbi:MAG TPA: AsmA-like C-terminal region-containing protein [Flavobacteriales bacterium]|nr:AsmA-like C-terminal region-containing protein [Flavobacteriales bacterium]
MFRKKKTGDPKKKKSLLRRILKWTGISFLVLLILAIILPFLFQKQIFEYVKKEINNNLNAEFKCEDYSMTLISTFPNFTLELKDVQLNGIKEFKGTSLLKVKSLLVTVDIKSVLWGDKIDIKKIGIVNANINALVLENGKANWDIVKTEAEKTPEQKQDTASNFALKLQKYYIENTNIVYDDRQGGTYLKIDKLNHTGTGDFTADQSLLETTTTTDAIDFSMGGMAYMKKVKTDIKMNVDMDLKNSKYTFKQNSFVLNDFKLDFDGWVAMANDLEMDVKFKSNENRFKNLLSLVPGAYTKDFASVKVDGSTKFDGFVKGKMNEKSMPAFAVNLDVNNGSFHYPGLPKSATGIFIDGKASAGGNPSMDDMKINIPRIAMSLGGNPLSGHFNLVTPMSDPGIDLGIKTDINLATLKDVIPVGEGESYNGHLKADVAVKGHLSALEAEDYEKFQATGNLVAEAINYSSKELGYDTKINKAELTFSPKILDLVAFDSEVGKTSIKANGKLENYLPYIFKGETIKGNLDLSSPLVDLKEFMGTTSETPAATGATATTTETAPADPNASYVIGIPKNIDFAMSTSFGKVIYPAMYPGKPDLIMENVSGGLIIRDETLMFNNLKMNTLGGDVTLGGSYNTTNIMEPAIKMTYNIQNLDIKQTSQTFNAIEKMAPIASKCTGKFSSVFDMNAKLDKQLSPLFNTLTGGGYVASKNIFIEGFEPLNKMAQELKIQKLAKQNIQDIKVFFEFKDGKVWVKPYDVKVGNYKTNIGGNTAFTGEIDYDIAMAIPRSEFGGEANNVLNSLVDKANKSGADVKLGENVNLKIKMTGTVTDPKLKTNLKEQLGDVKEDIKEEIKEKIEEKVKEVKEDVNEKLDAEKKKILADAKVQADKIKAEGKRLADQTRAEAKKAGEKLIEEAGNNPIKKKVAEKSAEKINKEGEEKAQKIENEANTKADKVMSEAQEKADNVKVK